MTAVITIGKRSRRIFRGRSHNVPLMFIGCFVLLVSWFGFNSGSASGFDDIAILAGINTFVASYVSTIV